MLTPSQPRTALRPGKSPTGLERDLYPTCPASDAHLTVVDLVTASAAVALELLVPTQAASEAEAGEDLPPSLTMERCATLATGSAGARYLLLLHQRQMPWQGRAGSQASRAVLGSPPLGAKAAMTAAGHAVSSSRQRVDPSDLP
jgi:hypothetical protein